MPKMIQIRNVPDATHREIKARAALAAVYLALAESLPAVLLTSDERLARVPGVKVHVDVVKRARHDE